MTHGVASLEVPIFSLSVTLPRNQEDTKPRSILLTVRTIRRQGGCTELLHLLSCFRIPGRVSGESPGDYRKSMRTSC